MFVRTSSRRNKDGTVVRYLQLAHNEWDPAATTSRMKVLYNFGRVEDLDRATVHRLVASLRRLLGETSTPGLSPPSRLPLGRRARCSSSSPGP